VRFQAISRAGIPEHAPADHDLHSFPIDSPWLLCEQRYGLIQRYATVKPGQRTTEQSLKNLLA
jgi:hypothetical protein